MAALKSGGKFAILTNLHICQRCSCLAHYYTAHNIHYTAHTIYSTINNIQHHSRPHVHNTQYTKSAHLAEVLVSGTLTYRTPHTIHDTYYTAHNLQYRKFADSGRVADFSQIAPADKHDAP